MQCLCRLLSLLDVNKDFEGLFIAGPGFKKCVSEEEKTLELHGNAAGVFLLLEVC